MLTAAMMFPACSSDDDLLSDIETPEQQMLTLVADIPDVTNTGTRTEIGYDEDGNIVPMWSKMILWNYDEYPESIVNDYILAKFEGQKSIHIFSAQINGPSRTARFIEKQSLGSIHSTCTLEEDLKGVADTTDVYFFKSSGHLYLSDNNPAAPFYGNIYGFGIKAGTFSDDDILISKPIKVSEIKNRGSEDVELNFKRINAIIRINLMPDDDVDLSNIYMRKMILDTRSPNDDKNFGGEFTFDKDGNIELTKVSEICYSIIDDSRTLLAPVIKLGEDGYPAYVCCIPIEFEAGCEIELTLKDIYDRKVIQKTLTVPASGIKLNAGEITTFNVKIQKGDLNPYNPNIHVDKAGALTKEMLEGAIKTAIEENDSYFGISGNINAQDIDLIRQALTNNVEVEGADGIFLNLCYANLISDGTTYTDSEGNKLEMKENTIGKDMFYGMKGAVCLLLPDCVTKIETDAITNNENLRELIIGDNVTTIEKHSIALTDKEGEEDRKLNIWTSPDVLKNIDSDFFIGDTSGVILFFNENEWEKEEGNRRPNIDKMTWYGYTWKDIWLMI